MRTPKPQKPRFRLLPLEPSAPGSSGGNALERWKAISTIASALAIPIILAVIGYFVQKQLADEGLKKDYVAIATSILKENAATQDKEFRRWAVNVLDSYSPIPFTPNVRDGLERGTYYVAVRPARMPPPPDLCMKGEGKERVGPLIKRFEKEGVVNTQQLAKQYAELIAVALQVEAEAMSDRAKLTCLRRYGQLIIDAETENDVRYAKPISGWGAASAPNK